MTMNVDNDEMLLRAANELAEIASQLRQHLAYHDCGASEDAARDAAAAMERTAAYLRRLDTWHKRGEAIMERARSLSAMFALGEFWADRPWRTKGG